MRRMNNSWIMSR